MSRIAFDIETVSPDVPHDQRPDFKDANDFEFLISGLGYQVTPGTEIETELIFRYGWGATSELQVIEQTLDWIEDRDPDQLITYNGTSFDLNHLRGRAVIVSSATDDYNDLVDRIDAFLNAIEHIDLRDDAVGVYGNYPRLEDVCRGEGVDTESTYLEDYGICIDRLNEHRGSATWGDAIIGNADVPVLGEWYLDSFEDEDIKTNDKYFEALSHYARADIEPLFELADKRPF